MLHKTCKPSSFLHFSHIFMCCIMCCMCCIFPELRITTSVSCATFNVQFSKTFYENKTFSVSKSPQTRSASAVAVIRGLIFVNSSRYFHIVALHFSLFALSFSRKAGTQDKHRTLTTKRGTTAGQPAQKSRAKSASPGQAGSQDGHQFLAISSTLLSDTLTAPGREP